MVIAPLLLAAVLAFSGVAKLGHVDKTVASMRSLRLPRWPWVAAALPWVEIALAVLLVMLPAGWATAPAVATLALMLAYLVIVLRALRGPAPADCGCFGDAAPSDVTGRTVARNAVFVAVAGWTVYVSFHQGVLSALVNLGDEWVWIVGMIAVVAVVYLTFAAPKHSDEDLEDYLRSPIPYGSLTNRRGETVTLRDLARTQARLLFFVTPTCGACQPIHDHIDEWMAALPQVGLHIVYSSPKSADRAALSPTALERVLVDEGQHTARLFDQFGSPWAVLLGADGMLAGGPVMGTQGVKEFVADIQAELTGSVEK